MRFNCIQIWFDWLQSIKIMLKSNPIKTNLTIYSNIPPQIQGGRFWNLEFDFSSLPFFFFCWRCGRRWWLEVVDDDDQRCALNNNRKANYGPKWKPTNGWKWSQLWVLNGLGSSSYTTKARQLCQQRDERRANYRLNWA